MTKVILKGYILVPTDDLESVENELETHKVLTLNEPGCITFSVIKSKKDPCRFDVYEEFIDKAAFEAHQNRIKTSIWGEVSANIKRHYEIAE